MNSSAGIIRNRRALTDGHLVELGGEINFAASPELRAELLTILSTNPARLVIDLTGVPYMDSSGIATLVELLKEQKRRGGKLVVCALQPRVKSLFDIARLSSVFTLAPDAAAAELA